jgi:hypothetical protein
MRVRIGSYEVQIDEEDAHLLSSEAGYCFQVQDRSTANYQRFYVKARRNRNGTAKPYLHRLIMGSPTKKDVDHINGDGLDNRRCNLRITDRSRNMANQRRPVGPSGYRGVRQSNSGKCKPWSAIITVNRRLIYSCGHPTPEAAARARDALALKYFGKYAVLNFPEDGRAQAENAFAPALGNAP